MFLLRVFWVYNKVADSGDVMIEKQGFSIVDTHEPMIAMLLSQFCLYMVVYPYKNQILLGERRQGVCRFVPYCLHPFNLVSSH